MSSAARDAADWRLRAACRGHDTERWFDGPGGQYGTAQQLCDGCPVRAECLHQALTTESAWHRYGLWGGLTGGQRNTIPALPASKAAALTFLREHLAALDAERTPKPMPTTPATSPTPPVVDIRLKAGAETPELITTSSLLRWAEDHPDPDVQDQGARAEAALTGLRQRYAADQELTAITTEADQLEKRLAELRAREAELAPAPKKKRAAPARDYDSRTVRAWADHNGIDCPRVGQIPKRVLDAWRTREPK